MKTLFSHEAIAGRVAELGREISAVYGEDPLLCICVLKGAVIFFSDLVRCIRDSNVTLGFLRLSSYGDGRDPGRIQFEWPVGMDVAGRHVLIVEDIVDSGRSMERLLGEVRARGPLSVRLAALVDKRERRVADVHVDFPGFVIDSGFIVGYGLDCAERWRGLPDVCLMDDE